MTTQFSRHDTRHLHDIECCQLGFAVIIFRWLQIPDVPLQNHALPVYVVHSGHLSTTCNINSVAAAHRLPSFLSNLVVIIPILSRVNEWLSLNLSGFCSRDRYYFQTGLNPIPGKDNSTSLSLFFLNVYFLYCHIYCFVNSFATYYSEDFTYNWTDSQPQHLHRHNA